MNINTTINLDDLLNSNEENSSEETVEILKESIVETAKLIEENAPLPDFDAIVTEWSYRCDKGYPDMKSKSDMIKLQEILNEMGVKSPFKQIQLTEKDKPKKKATVASKPSAAYIKEFKQLIDANRGQLNFENESIYTDIFNIFAKMGKEAQRDVIDKFQSMKVEAFAVSGWKPFEPFFDARGKGGTLPGRGEMMAVIAIKGASSGGSKEKDLQIPGGSWEIKEAPNSIRMAKSGGIGYSEYVNETKTFYKLLRNINLDNPAEDKKLRVKLSKIFTDPAIIDKVYNVLIINFRGDNFKKTKEPAEEESDSTATANFFDRIKTSEWPSGVIDLHYNGFKELLNIRTEVIDNKDLINNAKLILRTSKQNDQEFYINPEDSEEIATAKPGKEVKIKVATPAKGDIVEFLQNMLMIMKHPLVIKPDTITEDLSALKNSYFTSSKIKGILYYNKGKNKGLDPQPNLGTPDKWIIYSFSQGNGKMALKEKYKYLGYDWINAQ